MIEIVKLSKEYGNTLVLDNIKLSLPRYGLIVIYGPSGCGKTTLLNCLAGLIPFNGSIKVNTTSIETLTDNQISDFRLRNYGFIFQDYKLFDNESIKENILFPLKSISNVSEERLERKCKDLMDIVGINILDKQYVKNLSGGEKQRVCIARALVNDPKIILADEPTGALDSQNGEKVMEILSKISKNSLVVVVSHDKNLCNKYADQIIELQDGKILKIVNKAELKREEKLSIIKNEIIDKKQNLPSTFLFKHSVNSIKQRKWRTVFCNMTTSLGLIGVGLAISLSSSISYSIKKSYSSLFKEPSLIFGLNSNEKSIFGKYSGSYYEALSIKKKYSNFVDDVGFNYICNFEEFFPDSNTIALQKEGTFYPIEGLSIRNVNEFEWLEYSNETFYPRKPTELLDDQIVLGLNIDMINTICFGLQIERTVSSLSQYILHNDLFVYYDLVNSSWQYDDQQVFNVAAFSLVKNPRIYHTNHLWNQYVYEECMRFPTIDNLEETPKYPWVMKKIPYFYVKNDRDRFLELLRMDEIADPYIFEIADVTYYPWLMLGKDIQEIDRIMFFTNTMAHIPMRFINYINDLTDNVGDPIYTNSSGYAAYSTMLMTGFSKPMYFSNNENELDNFLETYSDLDIDINEEAVLPSDILLGHFSKTLSDGVSFKPVNDNLAAGRKPLDLDEIVVSSGFLRRLGLSINNNLSVAYTYDQKVLSSGKTLTDFKTAKVKVVGVINDKNSVIFHYPDWTFGFFQCRLGVSAYNLQINQIILPLKNEKRAEETIKSIKTGFPQYEISNPLNDVNESVDEICGYIAIALLAFSIIAIFISIILLSITSYLHVLEARKEIALARCIGINKRQSRKFLTYYSLIMCSISFILSSFELLGISLITSLEISKTISSELVISFNPLSIAAMLGISFTISIFSSLIISKRINKFNPIEALNR